MGAPHPFPPAGPAPRVDALQHFVERRRQRFTATFPQQCDAILALIDRIEERGSRGPRTKLRLLSHRLSVLARTSGFTTVSESAMELERVIGGGGLFDAVLAREMVDTLHEALETDLAILTPPASPYTALNGMANTPQLPRLRILIVDDHAMLRGGLRAFLSSGIPGTAFGEAGDGAAALHLLRQQQWDIALLDISLPGRNGLDLLKDIKAEWPRLPVLVLSAHREDEVALRALKAGADGYMTKQCAPEELVKAVRKIMGGGCYVGPALAEQLALETRYDHQRLPHQLLSDREYDVMCRIALGKTVSEIGREMSLSVKTISTYRARILQKLGVRNNAEIVQYALRNRLVC
jgi:DNA-binding NarL/FixJ family response regulator